MMQSKATTVAKYLRELPKDRRESIQAVRKTILDNLQPGYEEGMQYGMIGYYVPHKIYPDGYHCNPKQPVPFASLASQKNYMSIYLTCLYGDSKHEAWLRDAWLSSGKKLNMGKSCIRFKQVDDLAIDILAEAIRRVPVPQFLEFYESSIKSGGKRAKK